MTATRRRFEKGQNTKSPSAGRTPAEDVVLRYALLRWFQRHGRSLPWRDAASPYAIWVSEVMLQQTQVATVIPFYQRFIGAFPTVERLAAAPLERVLEIWSGLGYYGRARLMHRAAKEIVARFKGEFPADYGMARSLPGVGDYTARAVLSIAYSQPFAVLDGNVARVVARLRARKGNIQQKSFRHTVEKDLASLLSPRRPGDFNQALMQLGQLVCLPRAPQCDLCPLRSPCRARRLGTPEDFPGPRPRRGAELHYLAAAVLRQGARVALVRGLDDGLLDGLWNFPAAFGRSRQAARKALAERIGQLFPQGCLQRKSSASVTHNITHRFIQVDIYPGELPGRQTKRALIAKVQRRDSSNAGQEDSIRWIALRRLNRAAVSRLACKIAGELKSGAQGEPMQFQGLCPADSDPSWLTTKYSG
ncbi:MAG: A/G-specific adenine glycosylase [Acidobacteria bacterium]|nr:A/G-specific adenine glycosylase [Acidobacteriota bacterium]